MSTKDKDAPDTVPTDDPTLWMNTRLDNVFAHNVKVQLTWPDIEAAVVRGAILPNEAHALWAEWADPGSPRRVLGKSTGAGVSADAAPAGFRRPSGAVALVPYLVGAAVGLVAAYARMVAF